MTSLWTNVAVHARLALLFRSAGAGNHAASIQCRAAVKMSRESASNIQQDFLSGQGGRLPAFYPLSNIARAGVWGCSAEYGV